MKIHNKKLLKEYAIVKYKGLKPFEIRLNDCDYQVGDLITYTVPDSSIYNELFKNKVYQITYITNYAQKEGYVVFTDKLLGETKWQI